MSDFFADKDVCSIVLEIPNAVLGRGMLGLWARTLDGAAGVWTSADRGGRPDQTPFLAGEALAAYNAASPADDDQFIAMFAHALEHTGGYAPAEARCRGHDAAAGHPFHSIPDLPASYPSNGRALTDDVQNHFLAIFTNGRVTSDGAGPQVDLLSEFPYLGPPQDFPKFARNLNTGGDNFSETETMVARNVVHHAPGRGSFLEFSVVPNP